MSGVFLSYSRADHALAAQIIRGLRAVGVAVWWDEDMRGVDWQQELERQISDLAAVVVLWTPNSANSKHVRDEARLGLETDKLVNASGGLPKPPFPYDRINALPLDGWTGREPHRGWTRLVETVEEKLVAAGGAEAGGIIEALSRREREVRQQQRAVLQAREAFQAAQAREGETADAAQAARAALERAEAQHQSVVNMRTSPAVQHAARQELGAARAAKDEVERVLRAAKADLAEASRTLTRAETSLEKLFSDADAPRLEAAVKRRPAAGTAFVPQPARDKVALFRRSAASTLRPGWIVGCVAAAVVLAGGAVLMLNHRPSGAARPANAAPPTSIANVTGAPISSPAAAEAAITGKWTLQNVSCAYAIEFRAEGGALSIGGATVKIASVDASGMIRTGADGRYVYSVSGDTLTMTAPNGERTSYTRCAA